MLPFFFLHLLILTSVNAFSDEVPFNKKCQSLFMANKTEKEQLSLIPESELLEDPIERIDLPSVNSNENRSKIDIINKVDQFRKFELTEDALIRYLREKIVPFSRGITQFEVTYLLQVMPLNSQWGITVRKWAERVEEIRILHDDIERYQGKDWGQNGFFPFDYLLCYQILKNFEKTGQKIPAPIAEEWRGNIHKILKNSKQFNSYRESYRTDVFLTFDELIDRLTI